MSDDNSKEFCDYATEILNDEGLNWETRYGLSDEEMIKAVASVFNWTPSNSKDNKEFKKSSAKSMKYAEEAIKAANDGKVRRSLKLANMITAFSEDAGDLALGHLIRVQIFDLFGICFHQKIEELGLCLKSLQPPKKMNEDIKLEQSDEQDVSPNLSKGELSKLLNDCQVESELPDIKEYYADQEEKKDKERKFTREIFTLKSPNPKAPALEDFVEIKYDAVKGRHLILTKDVPVGTTLFVDKPFVSGLADVFDLEISHCHHCFSVEFRPIPCPNCVFVLYCSEKCLEESKAYHGKYECSVFPDLYTVFKAIDNWKYLGAFATICTFGPLELFRAFQREQQQQFSQEKFGGKKSDACAIPGFDPETGIYDSSSFYTIFHMIQAKKSCSRDALIALALTRILQSRTDFFQQLELELEPQSQLKSPNEMAQFQDFITLALLKICTSFAVGSSTESTGFDASDELSKTWAFATEPTGNLASHACDRNFVNVTTTNLKGLGCAGVALRDLKKGEEIVGCYCSPFTEKPKAQRQNKLFNTFRFTCECVACLNDWPLMEKLEAEKDRPQFCCPLCSSKTPPQPEMMTKKNFDKIALNSGSGNYFICPQCKCEYKEEELMDQLEEHSMTLVIAEEIIEDEEQENLEALEPLKAASTFFQTHLIPPSYYQVKCQNLLHVVVRTSMIDVYD